MAKLPISQEAMMNNLPGAILFKKVKKDKSYFLWANQTFSEMVGYKNNDQIIGIRDEDVPSGAAEGAEQFYQHDQEVVRQGIALKTLDVYNYASNGLMGLLGIKKPFKDDSGNVCSLFYNGIPLSKADYVRLRLNELIRFDIKSGSFLKKQQKTYQLSEKIDKLTPRESECFFYLLRGRSCREISQILYRSVRTIELHVAHINDKLNIRNRSQLFDYAIEKGLMALIPNGLLERSGTAVINK